MATAIIDAALRRRAWTEVREACERALASGDDGVEVQHALALSFCGDGMFEAAVVPLEAALARDSANAARARNLAAVYAHLARWADVWRVLSPVVGLVDDKAQALYLAAALDQGEAAAAVARLEGERPPAASNDRDLLCDYGRALCAIGRLDDAEPVLRRAVAGPEPPVRAYDALATLYSLNGHGDLALVQARRFAELRPDCGYAQLRLAVALSLRGRLEESRTARVRALQLGIERAADWTSAIHLALADSAEDGVALARLAARAVAHIAPRQTRRRPPRPGGGRLRIGYLSPEFDVPPASYFLNPLLLGHDRSLVEVFLFDTRRQHQADIGTRSRLAEHVRDVGWLSDDAIADRIEADRIDVLVELSAHFADSRVAVLARRPASVQATLPQGPATTGCRTVDHLFTDRWTSPPGSDGEYTERLHHLASGCVIYTPPPESPALRPRTDAGDGWVTFGLLQRFPKIGSDVWDALADILQATPRSRLLLHNGDAELGRPDSPTCGHLRHQLASRGVDPARLRLVGPRSLADHLRLVQDLDVALDTWPYSGTTTTCECLWMGVPVVTLAGRTHASRVSAGLLHRCGLAQLVATDTAGYVAATTRLAGDREWLREARETLRPLMIERGLTDGAALAAEVEAAYARWSR